MSDFTEKNRQVFEKMASTYKTDFGQALQTIYQEVQGRRHWASDTWTDTEAGKGKEIRMLEYACGPGNVSLALAPFVSEVIGLDVSDAMVSEYNNNAREAGMAKKMSGRKGDLLADTVSTELSGPEFSDFDIVFVSMALHHFEKPDLAMERFGERLKRNGVCLIIDLVPDHEHDHEQLHEFAETRETIKTHGFMEDDMRKLYEGAGLGKGFDYQVIKEPLVFHKNGKKFSKTIFIARGQRL
ncbi:S-adenosyl-L-methionine-dependent methyltransferase [Aspergillus ambiguus]|uniref:class I SAM-dependent DNA methyltransferase n=1 Tax=Aspergillus ambiguus TaxID=176160 RepID=UPI003CCD72EB